MSTRLVGWALRDIPQAHPQLSTGARLLLVYLADHFNEDEGAAWPSQTRLARLMGCSERSTRNYLNELLEAGILTSQMRSGTSNMYRMTPENTAGVPRQNLPGGAAKSAGHPGNVFRLSSKEPIKEQPADPETAAKALAEIRRTLRGKELA